MSIIHVVLKRASLANMGSTADDALARRMVADDALAWRMVAVMRKRLLHGAAESEGWVPARKLSGYFKAPLTDIVYIAQHAVRYNGQLTFLRTSGQMHKTARPCGSTPQRAERDKRNKKSSTSCSAMMQRRAPK